MIRLEHVTKTFRTGGNHLHAVQDVNLTIDKGEIFGIIGFSGAGKSTLVRCINLLERPTKGAVYFEETNLMEVSERELLKHRQNMGMIFQHFYLLSQRNVLDNVLFPLEIIGMRKQEAREKAGELLKLVGLTDKARAYPAQLSGGQKQRVAIARALATNPKVLLCDEATSALDPETTRNILSLIKEINEKLGVTVVIITHEMRVIEQICDRVAVMNKGTVEEVGSVKEVFLHPKSQTAKRLLLPQENELLQELEAGTMRIAFDGQSSFEPVISRLTLESGALINILGANTENIGGKAYGQMLIELPKEEEGRRKIKSYLAAQGIHYEEGGEAHE
ncbi:MAG: methionine ABC transporter ATP-binding protein [Lachnospiraceae bacterium]